MTTKTITKLNYFLASTPELEKALDELHEGIEREDSDGDFAEYLDDLAELISDELVKREEDMEHDDTPSLQDRGIELGGYGS